MKLYDVPRNTRIRVLDKDNQVPPGAAKIDKMEELDFKHIDGMYSLCINKQGQAVHLVAWAEVEIIK